MEIIKILSKSNILVEDDGNIATILHVGSKLCFYISSIDIDYISNLNWSVDTRGYKYWYVTTRINNHTVFLHRYIIENIYGEIPLDLQVDHIDRNPSNNTRENLRLVSHRTNGINRYATDNSKSGLIGVKPRKDLSNFESVIKIKTTLLHLGSFKDPYDAALVHDSYIYNNLPEEDLKATNIYNNKIPKEILDEKGINSNDLSTIPFIVSNKKGNNNYNGVLYDNYGKSWKAVIRNENGVLKTIKQSKQITEIEAAAYREQYLLDHPELLEYNGPNCVWTEEDGKINVAGIILTKDEYEEKTRGY